MSRRRKSGELSKEDRVLWSRVARSVEPGFGKVWPSVPRASEAVAEHKHGAQTLVKPVVHPPYQPQNPGPATRRETGALDLPTRKKLARGRVVIDATIDLHDLVQSEAHRTLLAFLHRAHASGMRHVLVITGKGASHGSAGILRRAVPQWLATQPFRGLVSGFNVAARHHGGEGAIYVKLARKGTKS